MNQTGEAKPPASDNGATLRDRVQSLRLGGRAQARRPRINVLPWILCAICLAMTAAFGYRAYRVQPVVVADAGAVGDVGGSKSDSVGGLATTSVASSGEVTLQAKGYVTPICLIQVSPKVGGQLVQIHPKFEEGQVFKEGDVLAQIEDIDYEAEYLQARAAFESAEQRWKEMEAGNRPEEIEQAQQDLEESRRNLQQMKMELERAKRAGTAVALREFDQAKYAYEAMQARVNRLDQALKLMRDGPRVERKEAARADMEAARAMMKKAKWRLDNTRIRAPLTGTILTKKAEKGNIVNPSAFSSGISASLCDMADLRELEIDLKIQERDIAGVRRDQRCLVMPEAYQNDKEFLARHPQGYLGYVSRLMPTADRAQGAVPVRVRIPREHIPPEEAGVYLRPDMGALVSFTRETYSGPR